MAKKKKPAKVSDPLRDMTPEQRQQMVDIYRTFRRHFSRKQGRGRKPKK
jgi:hypothetical protein